MDANPRVVATCGSLRDDSTTRVACRRALDAAAEAGADVELVHLRTVSRTLHAWPLPLEVGIPSGRPSATTEATTDLDDENAATTLTRSRLSDWSMIRHVHSSRRRGGR